MLRNFVSRPKKRTETENVSEKEKGRRLQNSEVAAWWGKLHNEKPHDTYCSRAITMNENKKYKTLFIRRGNE